MNLSIEEKRSASEKKRSSELIIKNVNLSIDEKRSANFKITRVGNI